MDGAGTNKQDGGSLSGVRRSFFGAFLLGSGESLLGADYAWIEFSQWWVTARRASRRMRGDLQPV